MKKILSLFLLLSCYLFASAQQKIIETEMTNLNIENYGFMFTASGSNEEYSLSLTVNSTSIQGTFDDSQISAYTVFMDKNGSSIPLKSRKATITRQDDDYTVVAELTDNEDVLYRVTMMYESSELKDEKLTFNDISETRQSSITDESVVTATSSDYTLTLYLKGSKLEAKTYEKADFNLDNSTLVINSTHDIIHLREATATITQSWLNKKYTMDIVLVGKNQTRYSSSFQIDITPVQPKSSVTIDVPASIIVDQYSQYGIVSMDGKSSDEKYYVSLAVKSNSLEGSFSATQISAQHSYIGIISSGRIDYLNLLDCDLSVSKSDGITTLTARVVASDDNEYNITMIHSDTALDGDNTSGQVDATYTDDEIDFFYLPDNGSVQLHARQADNSSAVVLEFHPSPSTEEYPLPLGEYTISSSCDEMTVTASSGIVNNQLTPSYYMHTNTEDGMSDAVFFLISGIVNVQVSSTDLVISVEAVNSHGLPIHINMTIHNAETLVPSITLDRNRSTKTIDNGKIIINANGRIYDTNGRVKC